MNLSMASSHAMLLGDNTDTLLKLQIQDPTVESIRSKVKPAEEVAKEQVCFLQDKGLIYRMWQPRSGVEGLKRFQTMYQLVVPQQCRE